jgi:pSer/pThr/pTyr-binding forkhead associated (FHA) protein
MLAQLIPTGGGDPIPLAKPKLLVGRRPSCDITLAFPNVSSHHCELIYEYGHWTVRDLGSSNGLKVNGLRCTENVLRPGDVLSIAKHTFEIQYTPDMSAQQRPDAEEEESPFKLTLLQKAGLEPIHRRPERDPNPPRSTPPSKPKPKQSGPVNDEDQIVDWISE